MNDFNDWNKTIIKEFRANDGNVGDQFAGMPLLLLNTTGAKSGLPRTNPMAYLTDGDRLVVIASKAGAPSNPDWYYNVVANPVVGVEVGAEQFQADATVAEEPERTQLFERMATKIPGLPNISSKRRVLSLSLS